MPASTPRYTPTLIALHWIMVLLIAAVYATIELREFFPRGSPGRDAIKAWHFTLGLSVLALVVARIVVRLRNPSPPVTPPLQPWQAFASRAVHVALYALMVAMPIMGWLILSGEGKPIPFWFGIELPPLIAANKDFAETVEEVHETVGKIGYFLIGLHAAAALAHHYVFKDNTFARMLPKRAG